MASITIRKLDDSLKEALRRRAAGNRRSMEEEARVILHSELRRDRSLDEVGLGTWLANRFAGQELVIAPRTELPRKPPFVTDEEWEK